MVRGVVEIVRFVGDWCREEGVTGCPREDGVTGAREERVGVVAEGVVGTQSEERILARDVDPSVRTL